MSPPASESRAPAPWLITAAIIVLCLIWGSAWLVIKDGLQHLPPFLSAGVRFVVAGLVMVLVAATLGKLEGGDPPPRWLWVLIASTNFALSYGIIYFVQQFLPSGLVSVLWAVYPLMMAASGHILLPGEQLRALHWVGFVLGFLGMVLLFQADLSGFGWGGRGAALLLLLSPCATAIGTTALKRHGARVSSLALNRNAMLLGGALLLAVSALSSEPLTDGWTTGAVLGMLYLALFGTVVTLGLYYWVLRYVPANKISLIAYVTPAIALFLGWALDDEVIHWTTLVGAVAIAAGIAIATRPAREPETVTTMRGAPVIRSSRS